MQYKAVIKDDDALRFALIGLAKQYGHYGYREVGELLRIEGWRVNHKKVERLWREEGCSFHIAIRSESGSTIMMLR